MAGPFYDPLFELLIQSLDFGLGLLDPGGFDDVPTPVSLCCGKLVGTHHIQDFSRPARGERIGAQHGQALIGDRLVEGLFVFAKVLPVLLFEPGRISSDSHAGVAAGQCASELLMPGANHSLQIKRAILEIPLAGGDNLYAVACQVAIKLGDGLIQRMLGFVNRHGLGNHPQAELFAFQSSLAIGDQRVEDIVFRLVEEAKMCAPGHVADDVDSGLPHLVCHRGHLPVFILGIAAANPRGFRLSRSAAPAAAAGRLKENVAPGP